MSKGKEVAVMVTTDKRGVFFGYTNESTIYKNRRITLSKARNCIYWSSSVRGFLGLTVTGPDKQCKVGPAAPSLTLEGVESVSTLTPEAVEAWEKAPWA